MGHAHILLAEVCKNFLANLLDRRTKSFDNSSRIWQFGEALRTSPVDCSGRSLTLRAALLSVTKIRRKEFNWRDKRQLRPVSSKFLIPRLAPSINENCRIQ